MRHAVDDWATVAWWRAALVRRALDLPRQRALVPNPPLRPAPIRVG
jgi:hypothetical protein